MRFSSKAVELFKQLQMGFIANEKMPSSSVRERVQYSKDLLSI